MGINLVFGLICEDVRLELNGKVSIIGESNLFNLPKIPITIPLCILTKWAGAPGTRGRVSLQMVSPDSTAAAQMGSQEILLSESESDTAYTGTICKLGWQVQTTGVHIIQILLDGEEKGRIEMMVRKANQLKN